MNAPRHVPSYDYIGLAAAGPKVMHSVLTFEEHLDAVARECTAETQWLRKLADGVKDGSIEPIVALFAAAHYAANRLDASRERLRDLHTRQYARPEP